MFGRNHHHHHHHPPPPPPNSFLDALAEYPNLTIADIEQFVTKFKPQLDAVLQAILNDKFLDPNVVVELLRNHEERQRLQNLDDLVRACGAKQAVVIWPIPPHIHHRLMPILAGDAIFTSDDHELPPHLWHINATPIGEMLQRDFDRLRAVRAVAVDAHRNTTGFSVRRDAARFLETLRLQNNTFTVFAHIIDHIPHRERFVEFGEDLSICVI